ncbi:MAG: DUF4350 domain-containing protein [Deltaproteobacteria bacterium]|nr:DUF4350 domain-containing protein [Deltaproteobacteria bacterium]
MKRLSSAAISPARPRSVLRGLIAGMVAVALVGGVAQAAGPSSFSKKGDGAKVLYRLLEDLGYRVVRVFSPRELDHNVDVVVSLGPVDRLQARAILEWTKAGRAAVVAPPLAVDDALCKDVPFGKLTIQRQFRYAKPKAEADGDLVLKAAACTLKVPTTARQLAGEKGQAVAFEHGVEAGHLLVLAHSDLLANDELDRDDLVVLLRRWLAARVPKGARIAFFEVRHGGALLELVKRAHLGPLLVHLLLFLILVYWMVTPRFGETDLPVVVRRRAFAEHARALGHLYQAGQHSQYVLRQLYERLRARRQGRPGKGHEAGSDAGAGSAARGDGMRGRVPRPTAALLATRTGREASGVEATLVQVEETLAAPPTPDGRDVQRHFRLSQLLAALGRGASAGGKRGRTTVR